MTSGRRKRMMTRWVIISIAVLAMLFGGILYSYDYGTDSIKSRIDTYNARKEDVLSAQQKIQRMILELNQTIAKEEKTQEMLIENISKLSKMADLPPPIIKTTIEQVPAANSPAPTPVTRAS